MKPINRNSKYNSNSNDELFTTVFENKPLIIKKFSKDIERALKNVKKQKDSDHNFLSHINAVPINDIRIFENHIEVEMPYVYGVIGQDYASITTKDIALHLSDNISLYIYSLINSSNNVFISKSIFIDKMKSVKNCKFDTKYKVFFDKFYKFIETQKEEVYLPVGPCHGDLTLSNIIYENTGKLKLIDFLYTYLESPMQDVCKIDQDYRYGWSFRYMENELKLKSKIFTLQTTPKVVSNLKTLYPEAYRIMMYLNLLRIIPYIKDEITDQWLFNTLTIFTNEEIK